MEENIQASGGTTKCMVKEFLNGQTAEDMMANMLMIKKKDKEHLNGKLD